MLEVRQLAVSYGRHRALRGVDLQVAPGEIVVILGANGAGKTSLLKAVAGMVASEASSRVTLEGKTLTHQPPHRIVEAGLALVPEGRGIFGDLSVRENLLLGAFAQRARSQQAENLQRVLALFPRLAERSSQLARTMSGGEQQMVAIGRALMSAPAILMLDEPSLGLSPLLCSELFKNLRAVRATGVGILLVEQNARQSLAIADRAYLLENGQIVGSGPAEELAHDPAVQAAYLGGAASKATSIAVATTSVKASTATSASAVPLPQGSASLQGGTATALPREAPFMISPRAAASSSTPADALLPVRVADLVRIATRRQDDHVQSLRGAAPATDPALAGRAFDELQRSGTLDAALASVGAAAAAAVHGGSRGGNATAPFAGNHTAGGSTASASNDASRSTSLHRSPAAASPTPSPSPSQPQPSHASSQDRARQPPSAHGSASPPHIEVWRRPGVEVFRRHADGQLHRED